jgi:hypothetical protein
MSQAYLSVDDWIERNSFRISRGRDERLKTAQVARLETRVRKEAKTRHPSERVKQWWIAPKRPSAATLG